MWTWNGLDSDGNPVPDQTYEITIGVQDETGNTAELTLDTKVIVDSEGGLELLKPRHEAFSPNNDKRMDLLPLNVRGKQELLDSFVAGDILVFAPKTKEIIDTIPITDRPPVFYGMTSQGTPFPDGKYEISLQLFTDKQDGYLTNKVPVSIDTKPPRVFIGVQTSPQTTPRNEPLYFGSNKRARLDSNLSFDGADEIIVRVKRNFEEIYTQKFPVRGERMVFFCCKRFSHRR